MDGPICAEAERMLAAQPQTATETHIANLAQACNRAEAFWREQNMHALVYVRILSVAHVVEGLTKALPDRSKENIARFYYCVTLLKRLPLEKTFKAPQTLKGQDERKKFNEGLMLALHAQDFLCKHFKGKELFEEKHPEWWKRFSEECDLETAAACCTGSKWTLSDVLN